MEILKENLKQSVVNLGLSRRFFFQHQHRSSTYICLGKELSFEKEKEWAENPQRKCHKLVENYSKRRQALIQLKGDTIDCPNVWD